MGLFPSRHSTFCLARIESILDAIPPGRSERARAVGIPRSPRTISTVAEQSPAFASPFRAIPVFLCRRKDLRDCRNSPANRLKIGLCPSRAMLVRGSTALSGRHRVTEGLPPSRQRRMDSSAQGNALSFVRFSGLEELLSVAGESLVAPGNYWASGRIKKRLDWEFRFRGDLDSRRGRGGTSVHNATEPGWLVVTGGAPEQSTVHPASWRAQCRASQSSAKSSIRSMPLEMDCGPGGPSPLRPRCPPKRPSHWII